MRYPHRKRGTPLCNGESWQMKTTSLQKGVPLLP